MGGSFTFNLIPFLTEAIEGADFTSFGRSFHARIVERESRVEKKVCVSSIVSDIIRVSKTLCGGFLEIEEAQIQRGNYIGVMP